MTQQTEPMPAWRTEEGRREVWRKMATWYIDNGLAPLAMEMVQRLHDAGEYSAQLDIIQARAQTAQGIPNEAVRLLEDVLKKHPKIFDGWLALGIARVDTKAYPEAVAAFERAVRIDAHHAGVRNNLGFSLMSMGRCAEALTQFEAAISENGTEPRYRNNLAFAAVCMKDHERALALFRTTMPEAEARYNLAVAFEHFGSVPSAILQYRAALDADPKHQLSIDALARLDSKTPLASSGTDDQPQ